jgi:FixJ family two-component response regulator
LPDVHQLAMGTLCTRALANDVPLVSWAASRWMSGLELQAWLRAQGSTIPLVIITAHGDFLEKPFEVHKTRIMDKLEVRNLAELVRFAVSAERRDEPT